MSVSGQLYRGVVPAATNAVTMVTATVNAGSTWYQLIASTSATIYITEIIYGTSGNTGGTVDVGTGGAGAEVVVASSYAYYPNPASSNQGQHVTLSVPVRVPSGTRVAIRAAAGNAIGGVAYVSESAVV